MRNGTNKATLSTYPNANYVNSLGLRPYSPVLSNVTSIDHKSSQTNATLEEFVTRLQRLHTTLGLRSTAAADSIESPISSLTISEDDFH